MNWASREYGFTDQDPPGGPLPPPDDTTPPAALTWYPAASADRDHPDEETDLCAAGNPGGAAWASVTDEGTGGPYAWAIYSRWLWEDIDADPDGTTLARGPAATMAEGKAAIETWVSSRMTPSPEGTAP